MENHKKCSLSCAHKQIESLMKEKQKLKTILNEQEKRKEPELLLDCINAEFQDSILFKISIPTAKCHDEERKSACSSRSLYKSIDKRIYMNDAEEDIYKIITTRNADGLAYNIGKEKTYTRILENSELNSEW